ncbi:MAG: hypothetical protein P8N76_19595 [Pirellulaceae bacterium]|nr:hypothetical protein [Pirellulaceae bacterium]
MALRLARMMLFCSTIGGLTLCDSIQAQRFRFRLSAVQGSNRSITSTSTRATLPDGGFGSVSNGTLTPFVTGFVPIVGRQSIWQRQYFPPPRGSLPKIEASERQQRRAEANDALRNRAIDRYVRKAEHELRMGRTGMARVYYRLALKRAEGDARDQIEAKILILADPGKLEQP